MTAAGELGLPPLTPPGVYLDLFVPGRAAPQGSKSYKGNGRMEESSVHLAPWRSIVSWTTANAWHGPLLDEPLSVELEFVMRRPQSLPKRKPTPACTTRIGDVDKLARGVLDAITHVLIKDDALVTRLVAERRYAEVDEQPGARIRVSAA